VAGLLQSGAILDKYRIEEVLGTGGFAAVYRATHLLLQIRVAIKLLRPRVLERHPGIAEQLLQEARYAARINHANVVRIHDVTHTPAITFIVMEHIDGGSLARRLASDGPLPVPSALAIGIDVAEGLRAGLEQGLVHRDIKPANILLPHSRAAKIVDFGLAHVGSLGPDSSSPAAVGAEPVVGTRGYMAPEQLRAPSHVDFRADIYALGVTLLEAVTGRAPYRRVGAEVRKTKIEELLAQAPASVARLLARMVSEHPNARPRSYAELVAELRAHPASEPGAR
jgi:serine/threonine protein kinase